MVACSAGPCVTPEVYGMSEGSWSEPLGRFAFVLHDQQPAHYSSRQDLLVASVHVPGTEKDMDQKQ